MKVRALNHARGPESSLDLRMSQFLFTKLWCWSVWPQAIRGPSSPGAALTVNPSMCTTPKCWAMGTWLLLMSIPSTVESTSAGPPPLEPATTPLLQPTSQFKVQSALTRHWFPDFHSPACSLYSIGHVQSTSCLSKQLFAVC